MAGEHRQHAAAAVRFWSTVTTMFLHGILLVVAVRSLLRGLSLRHPLSSPLLLPSLLAEPHIPSWLLHALAHSGRAHDAVRVLDHMRARGLSPDAHAGTALLTALARARMTATARGVFDEMARASALGGAHRINSRPSQVVAGRDLVHLMAMATWRLLLSCAAASALLWSLWSWGAPLIPGGCLLFYPISTPNETAPDLTTSSPACSSSPTTSKVPGPGRYASMLGFSKAATYGSIVLLIFISACVHSSDMLFLSLQSYACFANSVLLYSCVILEALLAHDK